MLGFGECGFVAHPRQVELAMGIETGGGKLKALIMGTKDRLDFTLALVIRAFRQGGLRVRQWQQGLVDLADHFLPLLHFGAGSGSFQLDLAS